jgi:hypothetical protein
MKQVLVILMLFIGLGAAAQKFSGSLNFQLGLPQGEYKQVNGKTGVGGRFNFLYKPSPTLPVSFGLELGYQLVGSQSTRFNSTVLGFYDEYKLTATSNIFSALVNVRVSPLKPGSTVMPFVDGMFGWNDFFSTVSVEQVTYYNNGGANSNSSDAKWAATYGVGAGLDIRLDKRGATYLELKTAYMIGRRTIYLTDPTIYNDGSVTFAEKESETDMIIPQVGIHFRF